MYFRVFSLGKGTEWGYFWGCNIFKFFFWVLDIPDICLGKTVDAGFKPT